MPATRTVEFYAYITRKGAVRVTRRRGQQRAGEVCIRLLLSVPMAAWDPEGVPTAKIEVPLESVKRPMIELFVEALRDGGTNDAAR